MQKYFANQGILPSLVLLAWLLVLQRSLSKLATRSASFERKILGETSIIVKDGRIELGALEEAHVSREQLFATLRTQRIRHLGEVARVYLEACGAFSVLRAAEARPGLTLAPSFEDEDGQAPPARRTDLVACGSCGDVQPARERGERCACCGRSNFRPALGEPHEGEPPKKDAAHAA